MSRSSYTLAQMKLEPLHSWERNTRQERSLIHVYVWFCKQNLSPHYLITACLEMLALLLIFITLGHSDCQVELNRRS